ncbi:MAG TPA: multicopper oxidase domain-containing protein [Candidatus Angelobacter sp.]|nr:multicopper oxidase domain-containing protein [Candidatus Angelobacter sp.]
MRRRYGLALLLLSCVSVMVGEPWPGGAGDDACPRPAPGAIVQQPPELHSQNGRLEFTLKFRISEDPRGLIRYCYWSDSGLQAPTLRLNPGDELVIHFRNELPGKTVRQPAHNNAGHHSMHCADGEVSMGATNLHFHGLNVPARCHQDDVMQTLIEPAAAFDYQLKIPANTTPGLYWYHPHPHPFSETQVLGGASGAIIVEGMASVYAEIRKLPERVLVLRDQKLPMSAVRVASSPGWDVSLNYVPVLSPDYLPSTLETNPHQEEFWRVLNAAADTIFDLQVMVNNVPQAVRLLAIDGVPLSTSRTSTGVLLPPGARAEFVITTPNVGDHAQLITKRWDTGPDGENDPQRPLANIVSVSEPRVQPGPIRKAAGESTTGKRYASLKNATPAARRKLYFSEDRQDPSFPGTSFYLTVDGQAPTRYKMEDPPNISARQGTVEDWILENRSREEHVFHIHQIHFQVLESDGKPVNDPAIRDTIDLPYWKGEGPYPSVKLRMDFRDPNSIGTLMYHCHILQHSANGMMGSIQVLPAAKRH